MAEIAPSSQWIKILVKYRNACTECKREILVGEEALWQKGTKYLKHLSCSASAAITNDNDSKSNPSSSFLGAENSSAHISKPENAIVKSFQSSLSPCRQCKGELSGFEGVRFCPHCGAAVEASRGNNSTIPDGNNTSHAATLPVKMEGIDDDNESDQNHITAGSERPLITIAELGKRLEDLTEEIFKKRGYSTERNQRLVGKSSTRNEIDIVAKRGGIMVAVECKNYSTYVGIDKLRDFQGKLQDLSIRNAVFVTSSSFSVEAKDYAEHHHIQLWDGDYLREALFLTAIGRAGAVSELTLPMALPVAVSYREATQVKLQNSSFSVKVSEASLVFHPYYAITYELNITRVDPARGKHPVYDSGTYIVDGLDGEIINLRESAASRLVGSLTKGKDAKADSNEQRHIVQDLLSITPQHNYRAVQTDGEYALTKVRPSIWFRAAIPIVVNQVIQDNTKDVSYSRRVSRDKVVKEKMAIVPCYREVIIKKTSLVYLPTWHIEFESAEISYPRRILAASGTVVSDPISICPKHFTIGGTALVRKTTFAVCETCGGAFCKDHIRGDGINSSSSSSAHYYCPAHGHSSNSSTTAATENKSYTSPLKKGLMRGIVSAFR